MFIDFESDFRFSTLTVPGCDQTLLENATTEEARARCGASLVGTGEMNFVDVNGPAPGTLSIFSSAPVPSGAHLLLHVRSNGMPAPSTLVIPAMIAPLGDTGYPYRLSFSVPTTAVDQRALVRFLFNLTGSVVTARCEGRRLDTRVTAELVDGRFVAGGLSRPCSTRETGGRTELRPRRCKKRKRGRKKAEARAAKRKGGKKQRRCAKKKRKRKRQATAA